MTKEKYTFKDIAPIFFMYVVVSLYTYIATLYTGNADTAFVMQQFMGGFFLLFGGFKLSNWKQFVEAYQMYDLFAMRSRFYGYAYPVIEVALGFAYVTGTQIMQINWITLILMSFSAIGVAIKLAKREKIMCACLGAVFKVPMTWVTFAEDALMAAMAAYMLFILM